MSFDMATRETAPRTPWREMRLASYSLPDPLDIPPPCIHTITGFLPSSLENRGTVTCR
jgi:hypothetical protein